MVPDTTIYNNSDSINQCRLRSFLVITHYYNAVFQNSHLTTLTATRIGRYTCTFSASLSNALSWVHHSASGYPTAVERFGIAIVLDHSLRFFYIGPYADKLVAQLNGCATSSTSQADDGLTSVPCVRLRRVPNETQSVSEKNKHTTRGPLSLGGP